MTEPSGFWALSVLILFLALHRVVCWVLFILYTSDMFDLSENRFFCYFDDTKLLAIFHEPDNIPAVIISLNSDLVRVHVLCSRWCMLLNLTKTDQDC